MTDDINQITGLADGFNAAMQLRVVNHMSIGRLRLSGQVSAENRVPIGHGRTLAFAGRLNKSNSLIVTFHGAHARNKPTFYPRYERFQTFKRQKAAFLCLADPTIQHTPNVLLAWYLGDAKLDPMTAIDTALDRAIAKTGAKKIIFVGGSGGGYAALRASLRRPGSAAFVESPRYDLSKAIPRTLSTYLDTFWQGRTLRSLQQDMPTRFDLPAVTADLHQDQQLYYLQGLFDPEFLWDNYRLAKQRFGIREATGTSSDGRATFALFEAPTPVHQPPPRDLFQQHWNRAMELFETPEARF